MREHLLGLQGFQELARPTSKHIDEREIDKFIEECEDIHIIPAVGLETFKRLCGVVVEGEDEHVILNGGEWRDDGCGCNDGELRRCHGLRKALAYFVYARLIQNDGSIVTRTGFVRHDDEWASRDDDKNRVRKYNEVMQVAETYLSTTLAYIKHLKGGCGVAHQRGTRVRIHKIGN